MPRVADTDLQQPAHRDLRGQPRHHAVGTLSRGDDIDGACGGEHRRKRRIGQRAAYEASGIDRRDGGVQDVEKVVSINERDGDRTRRKARSRRRIA